MLKRIQRKRTRGWRMPKGAIYCGRPTRWGNPWRVGNSGAIGERSTVEECLALYRQWIKYSLLGPPLGLVRGHDLACWCHLCEKHADGLPMGEKCPDCAPCHVDFLLEESNK